MLLHGGALWEQVPADYLPNVSMHGRPGLPYKDVEHDMLQPRLELRDVRMNKLRHFKRCRFKSAEVLTSLNMRYSDGKNGRWTMHEMLQQRNLRVKRSKFRLEGRQQGFKSRQDPGVSILQTFFLISSPSVADWRFHY